MLCRSLLVCGMGAVALVVYSHKRRKVLISVCCIDERAEELDECLRSIKQSTRSADILGVVRHTDLKCHSIFTDYGADIIHVPAYPTPGAERHNFSALEMKRSKALAYAQANMYDVLVFVDSDIRVTSMALILMKLALFWLKADIVCIPYPVRWAAGHPVLGYDNPPRIERVFTDKRRLWPFHRCIVGGMGCTAVRLGSPLVPSRFSVKSIMGVRGEDIGFFLDARNNGARVFASSWYAVRHQLKGELPPDYLQNLSVYKE